MKFCIEIAKQRVILTAEKLVREAKKDIIVTMDMKEELIHPLPVSYHVLLEKQAKKGVRVVRYGFGTKREYICLKPQVSNIQFVYAGSLSFYQRMIVIDGKKALFRLGDHVYYTEFPDLAACLVKYTEVVYNKEAQPKLTPPNNYNYYESGGRLNGG